MGDIFIEQIVKKQPTMKEIAIKGFILLAALLLSFFTFFIAFFTKYEMVNMIAFMIAVGSIYFAWYFITGLNLEFEYIYTNGEIDFDKISAKRKRKRVLTVRVSAFEVFEKYDAEKIKNEQFDKKLDLAKHILDENTYYALFRKKDGERCLLLFSPDERFVGLIEKQYKKRSR